MTANLVLRSIGRVLWFAIAGAICMALLGIVAGGTTGALIIFVQNLTQSRSLGLFHDVPTGALFGAAYAVYTGFWSGGIAFGIAGFFACLSTLPRQVFARAFRLASRATFLGVAIGAVLGPLNTFVWRHFASGALADPFSGYMYGVIGGFIVGTFYGAIVGARREIARQKAEQKNTSL